MTAREDTRSTLEAIRNDLESMYHDRCMDGGFDPDEMDRLHDMLTRASCALGDDMPPPIHRDNS
jgi:hypothetical protein